MVPTKSVTTKNSKLLAIFGIFFGLCLFSPCLLILFSSFFEIISGALNSASVVPKQQSTSNVEITVALPTLEIIRNTATKEPSRTSYPTKTVTLTPEIEPNPIEVVTMMAIQIPAANGAPCIPQNTTRQSGTLISIVDGDTIKVSINGEPFTVRYIGIDTPESNQTYGSRATNVNANIINDQSLIFIKDQSETDRYGRLLRYVIANDKFVNYELVKQGYASAKDYPPDSSCASTFFRAEQLARSAGIGLWVVYNIPPTSTKRIYGPPAATKANCDDSYPNVCIPPPPPDLDCGQIQFENFLVRGDDPHHFDGDNDGIGCES